MIRYFTEDIDFAFKGKSVHSAWLKAVAEEEGRRPGQISVIFCRTPICLKSTANISDTTIIQIS